MHRPGALTYTRETVGLYGASIEGAIHPIMIGHLFEGEWVIILSRPDGYDYYDCLCKKGRFYIYSPHLVSA